MNAIQELKGAGNRSEFGSVASGSQDKDDKKMSQEDAQSVSTETLNKMQRDGKVWLMQRLLKKRNFLETGTRKSHSRSSVL